MYIILFFLMVFTLVITDDLFITNGGQTFTSNLTHTPADQTEITRWMNLCASDGRCSRFAGLSLGGDNSVQTFNALLTLTPFTQLPPLFNTGIYDNLVNLTVDQVNDRLLLLSMVYEFSYFASGCSAVEIPMLLSGSMTCQTNPRLSGVPPSSNTSVLLFLMCLIVVLLVILVIEGLVVLQSNRNAIKRSTT